MAEDSVDEFRKSMYSFTDIMEGQPQKEKRKKNSSSDKLWEGKKATYVAAVCACCDTGAIEMESSRSIDILFDEADGDVVCVMVDDFIGWSPSDTICTKSRKIFCPAA